MPTPKDDSVTDLFEMAREYVMFYKTASVAMLQEKMNISNEMAAKLIILLEERGLIGKQIGDSPIREVLINK